MAPFTTFYLSLLTLLSLLTSGAVSTTFTFINKCDHAVWPGILSNAGVPPLPTTGFALEKGETKTLTAPTSWGGRFWARTLCSHDSTGKFTCETGDCGSGKLECSGSGATPPATLAEFTLDGDGGLDFYDVSLVDGYNLPMVVNPQRGSGTNCTATGCVVDLNGLCPSELRVNSVVDGGGGAAVACKSACEAFQQPQYCCSGAYGTPDTCKPSSYSQVFKSACPTAYSYAYDDRTSTFTCHDADYTITLCPAPNTSQKASQGQTTQPAQSSNNSPEMNNTMVYEGVSDADGGLISSAYSHVSSPHAISGAVVGVAVAAWQLWQLFL